MINLLGHLLCSFKSLIIKKPRTLRYGDSLSRVLCHYVLKFELNNLLHTYERLF